LKKVPIRWLLKLRIGCSGQITEFDKNVHVKKKSDEYALP
jgi:hypothetical protein